jgi:hypothetical protein
MSMQSPNAPPGAKSRHVSRGRSRSFGVAAVAQAVRWGGAGRGHFAAGVGGRAVFGGGGGGGVLGGGGGGGGGGPPVEVGRRKTNGQSG